MPERDERTTLLGAAKRVIEESGNRTSSPRILDLFCCQGGAGEDRCMHRIQTLFRTLDAPLHYVEDDSLNVGDVITAEYHGDQLTVKVSEVRSATQRDVLGSLRGPAEAVRMCIVVRPRPTPEEQDHG